MGVPSTRTPVRVARGTYANLTTTNALAALQDGEIAYATDTNTAYVVETESGTKALRAVTGISTSDLVDEDNMSSNSATKVPSQQSVKAYVDTQVATKQASDAELTELATMASGTAGALADLLQAEVEILDGATLTTTELNYVDGVTSAIQTQLDAKGVGDAVKASKNQWTGSQHTDINTLSISSNAVAIDFDTGNNFYLDMAGSGVTSVTASNPNVGQSGSIIIKGHASNTLAGWNAVYKFSGGTAPTITADAAKYDRIDYFIYATDKIHMVWSGNY